jgi:hypothetical protein
MWPTAFIRPKLSELSYRGRSVNLTERLAASLKSRKAQKLKPVKTSAIIASIRKVRAKLEIEVDALKEARRDIRRKSAELDRAIAEFRDAQKLAKNRLHVEKYIFTGRWIARATFLLASKPNTKPVTDLGKKASRELISDSFKERFQHEAANLTAPVVDLEFHGEYSSQMRAKNMVGLDGIDTASNASTRRRPKTLTTSIWRLKTPKRGARRRDCRLAW